MQTLTLSQAKNLLTNDPQTAIIDNRIRLEIIVKTKDDIIEQQYPDLIDTPITVTAAAKKYRVHRRTILHWKDKGYITVLEGGYQMALNEAEIAYCVDTYREQKRRGYSRGAPLFDEHGLPYELKRPDLSLKRKASKP